MQKRDIIVVADVIKSYPMEQRKAMAEKFADAIAKTNPLFKREVFIGYCMGTRGPSGGRAKSVPEGTEGQDRESYSDTQDRESYTVSNEPKRRRGSISKGATGEMSHADLEENGRQEYPLHYAVADALGGTVEPFDVYQGPYVSIPGEGRIFMNTEDGAECQWFNERTNKLSPEFWWEDENAAVDSAIAIVEKPPENTLPYGAERKEVTNEPEAVRDENWTPEFDESDKARMKGLGVKGHKKE